MPNIYHPKGSMCAVCVNKDLPCSTALQFQHMPAMSKYSSDVDVYNVVKCSMFNKLKNKGSK